MRARVTDALEIAGLLLLAVAVFLLVDRWTLAGGAAAAGVTLIGESALLQLQTRPRRRSEAEVDVA